MRSHYKNGGEIGLQAAGCDGCNPAMINGVFCHETGCPYAWKDYPKECAECGCAFYAGSRYITLCDDCWLDQYCYLDDDQDEEEFP